MDRRNALVAFRASCWTNARLIQDFVTGRESFNLTFDKAWELDQMRDTLTDQMEGMEETWYNVLRSVRQHSIDTNRDTVFGVLSRLASTRRIVDVASKVSGQFWEAPPVYAEISEDPGPDEAKDEVTGDILDDVAVDLREGVDNDNEVDKNAEDNANSSKVCHKAVQSLTHLTREGMEEALRERWKRDPGVCFCKNPQKHTEPVIVPNGYVKCRRSVFDTSWRSCYLRIDRIRAFLGCHKSVDATHDNI